MRRPFPPELERYRLTGPEMEYYGMFLIFFKSAQLRCQVSAGEGWEHVSVSLPNRCPNWPEMDFIKRLFWSDDEVVMQLHINNQDKVDTCKTCLHLWRPMTMDENLDEKERWRASGEKLPNKWATYPPIPLPPKELV